MIYGFNHCHDVNFKELGLWLSLKKSYMNSRIITMCSYYFTPENSKLFYCVITCKLRGW